MSKSPLIDIEAENIYYSPHIDGGMYLFEGQDVECCHVKRHPVRFVNGGTLGVGKHVAFNNYKRIQNQLWRNSLGTLKDVSLEWKTIPVVANEVLIERLIYSIGDKLCLFGKVGEYSRKNFLSINGFDRPTAEKEMENFFQKASGASVRTLPKLCSGKGLDFVIPCRNLFNFYHFISESLTQLSLIEEIPDFDGQIFFVCMKGEVSDFVKNFVEMLYPELAERVHFVPAPFHKEQAIVAYNSDFEFTFGDKKKFEKEYDALNTLPLFDPERQSSAVNRLWRKHNSYDSGINKIRLRGLKLIDGMDFSYLPKRFWIARSEEAIKKRKMKNEELLHAKLREIGFEEIIFGNLSPLEQIAVMNNAEFVIGQHGAGLTNMLFASKQTKVIEIGNYLSLKNTIADFTQFAQVGNCEYHLFIADIDSDHVKSIRNKSGSVLPIELSEASVSRIVNSTAILLGAQINFDDAFIDDSLDDLVQWGYFDIYEQLIDEEPSRFNQFPNIAYVRFLMFKKEYARAKKILNQILSTSPTVEAYILRIRILKELKRPGRMKKCLSLAINAFPENTFLLQHEYQMSKRAITIEVS